jgi:multidrug efflux pump subunit AcrB
VPGLRNVQSSTESVRQEVAVVPDRERVAALGLDVAEVGKAVRRSLEGEVVTDYLDGDRSFDVRLRLPRAQIGNPADLEEILLFPSGGDRPPVYLGDVAQVTLVAAPAEIRRDNQQRIVEVTAAPDGEVTLGEAALRLQAAAAELELPPEALQAGRTTAGLLLGLALFLVFVVMAVQYESLRNPLVILLSVPFAAIGAALGLRFSGLPLSMPVWLGLIMLAGIVVNNAIVLVEYVEILRRRGLAVREALVEAARLRLRPILMTTLTTVMGMLPLALGVGEGSELLQPLAVTIVSGLSFSLLVSLLLVPATYRVFHPRG